VTEQTLAGRRVLIIVENLPVPFDRRVWQEACALNNAGADVTVICPVGHEADKRSEVLDGVHIYRHPMPAEADAPLGYLYEYAIALFWEFALACRVLFTRGFDVIHGCNPPDLIFLVALPFKMLGKKYVFDHHDINPELFEAKFGRRGLLWACLKVIERLTFETADISIATNESYRKIAIERGRMKPEDVFVVRSGPDLSRIVRVSPDPKWRNGRRHVVGYVGVMGEQEGLDLLLESARYIVHVMGRRDVQFCLVGGGSSLARLKELAAQMDLSDYVTFTGRVPDAVLLEVLSTADLCVNPDRVNPMNDKSTMNKIIEYMALGKPIVQFEVTEGRYSAGASSLYADPNDPVDMARQIANLLDDPERRAEMGRCGRERVTAELSWDHQKPKLVHAYLRVFAKAAQTRGWSWRRAKATRELDDPRLLKPGG
jgi:glycosyltransferase involved in cell wall biosynthesis